MHKQESVMSREFSPTKLKAARVERGLSRQQLAFAARLNVDHVAGYERGRNTPRLESLLKLCDALSCSADELCEDSATAGEQRKSTAERKRAGRSRLQDGGAPARSPKKKARS
jgi:transcriptional regulator with XRE-family HTH domain